MCDEIIDTTKTVPTNFNEKKVTCILKISLFYSLFRSSHSEVFLRKSVLKICAKFTGEHSCQSATSIKLQSKCIEVALRDGCFPLNLLHVFRIPFPKNTSEWLLLTFLLNTIALLIAVSIYCYLIIYRAKQKHLNHFTSQIRN